MIPYDRAFQTTLLAESKDRVNLLMEYSDLWRRQDDRYLEVLRDFYRERYANQKIDVLVADSLPAIKFLIRYGEELFPQVPVVFCITDQHLIGDLTIPQHMTGVLTGFDFGKGVEAALTLQPDTQRVVVVGGTSQLDLRYLKQAREQFQPFEKRVQFEYLTNTPLEQIEKEISQLPPHTVVYFVMLYRDGANQSFGPFDAARRLAKASNAPFYSVGEPVIFLDSVGGYVWSVEADASETATIVTRVISGERPQDIPIHVGSSNRYIFDWRQLSRWGITEDRLPAGSILRNKELTLWQRYRNYILPIAAISLAQFALIVFLLVQRRRRALAVIQRKVAEEALRASEDRYRDLVENSNDLICTHDLAGRLLSVNPWAAEVLGYDPNELIGANIRETLTPEFQAQFDAYLETIRSSGFASGVMSIKTRNGESRIWEYRNSLRTEGVVEPIVRGMAHDVTEVKRAEKALRQALLEVQKLKNQLQQENIYLKEEIKLEHNFQEIIGESEALKHVLFRIENVAATDATVLLLGETGTGKELAARAVHEMSSRRDRPLVKVNCATLPANLIESELFGHERGAFTGAQSRKVGRFEIADGSTLFLDEIGELPLELQPKLLRVLQEGEFERVGGSRTIKVNVRIIAATNRDLKAEVERGQFREDLWYRVNVFPITMPPLRQRIEDIPLLTSHFVNSFNPKLGKKVNTVSPATMSALKKYPWPGNVRELANVIERALINSSGSTLDLGDQLDGVTLVGQVVFADTNLLMIERNHILKVLDETGWKIEGLNGAANALGLKASTLRTKMQKLRIARPK
jgi:PAS domain S-box-containing protein